MWRLFVIALNQNFNLLPRDTAGITTPQSLNGISREEGEWERKSEMKGVRAGKVTTVPAGKDRDSYTDQASHSIVPALQYISSLSQRAKPLLEFCNKTLTEFTQTSASVFHLSKSCSFVMTLFPTDVHFVAYLLSCCGIVAWKRCFWSGTGSFSVPLVRQDFF